GQQLLEPGSPRAVDPRPQRELSRPPQWMDLSAGREIDGLDCPEPPEDRRELRVLMLGRGREEQGIVPGDALDELVLALQVLAELEGIALALEPDLLLPLRPGMEPLLDESLVRGDEAVLITDVPHEERGFEERRLIPLRSPGEGIARHALVRRPERVRHDDGVAHEGQGRQDVDLAAGVGPIEHGDGQQALRVARDAAWTRVLLIPDATCLHGQHLLVAQRPMILGTEFDQHGESPSPPDYGL